jgi:hypothetical protein
LENREVDGRIILEWTLKIEDGKVETGFIWLRVGTSEKML